MTTCAQRIKDALTDGKCEKCDQQEKSIAALRALVVSLENDNEALRKERLHLRSIAYPVRSV